MCYSPLIDKVVPDDFNIKRFTDDHSLKKSLPALGRPKEKCIKEKLEDTFATIKSWMDQMKLKLNADKTEYITFGSRIQLQKVFSSPLIAGNNLIQMSSDVKYLGEILVNKLNFNKHITTKIKKAKANFICIRAIQKYLSKQACTTLILVLCISHLDYDNALLYVLQKKSINRFQTIENMGAKLVSQHSKYSGTTEAPMGSSLAANRTANSIQDTHNHIQRHRQHCNKYITDLIKISKPKRGQHVIKQCRNSAQCTTSNI